MEISLGSMLRKSLTSSTLLKSTRIKTPDSKSKTPNSINIIKSSKSPSINSNSNTHKFSKINKNYFNNSTLCKTKSIPSINKSTNTNSKSKPITSPSPTSESSSIHKEQSVRKSPTNWLLIKSWTKNTCTKSKPSKSNSANLRLISTKTNYLLKNMKKTPRPSNNFNTNLRSCNKNTTTWLTLTLTRSKTCNKPWSNSSNMSKKLRNKKSPESFRN